MTIEEIKRRKSRCEIIFIIGMIIIITTMFFGVLMTTSGEAYIVQIFVLFSFGIGIVFMFLGSYMFKKLKTYYKHDFVLDTFKRTFPDFTFIPEKGFDEDEVYDLGILKKSSRFSSEDYIKGKVLNYAFESADIHLQDLRSTGKSAHYVTVFRGRIYKIHINKKYPADIIIVPKRYNQMKLSKLYKQYEMESIEFSSLYQVYSNNHHEAMKFVKPVVINRILACDEAFKKLIIGFVNDTLYIGVDTREDHFDLTLFHDINTDIEKEIKNELLLTEDLIKLTV